ncbi:MAG: YciI family protein [Thermomicrobiales bacterium]
MLQYAYILKLVRPTFIHDATPEEQAIVGVHFEHLQRLFAAGTVIHVGRATDGAFGLTIFNAPDDDAATALMQSDPAVVHGIMTATLYPYRVVLHGEA